ncbi:ROK family protein [Litorihabitans aurantiacus]|uniref:ROK family protein n=1 Tax=Litorihabitans aurantiacus TaxID=1930061 RepID=UPI0024E17EF3|nr:ROK family protein [Litorihabitans aurantiacus]
MIVDGEPRPPRRVAPGAARREGAARQAGLRSQNLALVVAQVAAAGTISRADVAAATGLTRATVSSLVEPLIAARLLEWAPAPSSSGSVGRPASPVRLASATRVGLGLEIGANHLCASVVDLRGERLAFREVRGDLAAGAPTASLASAVELARVTLAAARAAHPGLALLGVTLAVPGIVRRGVVLDAPRLGWLDVDAAAVLREVDPDVAVTIGNEASLAALAESHARPASTFLYISGGVGVGGAHVVDGVVQGGVHGFASELGHVVVDPDGPDCRCGATGCLEQYAGAQAVARLAPHEVGRALGIALASAINVLDVAAVVVGGGLGEALPGLRPALVAELETRVLAHPWAPVDVSAAAVRDYPGLHGAALAPVLAALADPEPLLAAGAR